VLSAYTNDITRSLSSFRKETKDKFRNEFIDFFDNEEKSKFTICEKTFEDQNRLESFVNQNFKLLNGKCYTPNRDDNKLLIAIHNDDENHDKEKCFKNFLIKEKILDTDGVPFHKFEFQKSAKLLK
jgi:hypothetical protein